MFLLVFYVGDSFHPDEHHIVSLVSYMVMWSDVDSVEQTEDHLQKRCPDQVRSRWMWLMMNCLTYQEITDNETNGNS